MMVQGGMFLGYTHRQRGVVLYHSEGLFEHAGLTQFRAQGGIWSEWKSGEVTPVE
jgi:hypothetical protein